MIPPQIRRMTALAAIPAVLLFSTLAHAGASKPGDGQSAGTDDTIVVSVSHTSAGDALAGPNGMTLYVSTKDRDGASTCTTGRCATKWPAFEGEAALVRPGSGVSGTFATATWSDGTTQIVHNGQALYYYSGDVSPGDAKGQKPGGSWLVAPVGDSSACQVSSISDQSPEPTFNAPGPARHASEASNGEY